MQVCNARDNELGYLKKQFGILCWQILTGWGGSIFINATVLGSFILLYGDLHPGMVFGVVSVFSILSVLLILFISKSLGCMEVVT